MKNGIKTIQAVNKKTNVLWLFNVTVEAIIKETNMFKNIMPFNTLSNKELIDFNHTSYELENNKQINKRDIYRERNRLMLSFNR